MLIWDMLDDTPARGSLHSWEAGHLVVTPWREVLRRAHGGAAWLRSHGVGRGTQVACLLTNSAPVAAGLLAVWFAGGVVASLPLPSRGMDPREFARQVTAIVNQLDAPLVLVERRLASLMPDAIAGRVRHWESIEPAGRAEPTPPRADDVAFIQFSSGSTGTPKGCMLTARAISCQLSVMDSMFDPGTGPQRMGSWLPLSHDMGVFGSLLYPLVYDHDLVLSTPERFVMAPRTWFQDLADFRCTMTVATTTGLLVAARAHERDPLRGRLALSYCVVGAERVDLDVLRYAWDVLAPAGLRMGDFMPAYGMAEATLAVTAQPWWRTAPRAVVLNATRLAEGELVDAAPDEPGATTVVSTGPPCAGVSVSVADPSRLSEIVVQSPCLATGYFGDPVRTAACFSDSGFASGDLGFLRDGELFVVGRTDDLLSVGGRKVYARELEATVDVLEPVRPGRAVVLDLPLGGKGGLVLLVELKHAVTDYHAVATAAAGAIMAKAGIGLTRCLFLQRDSLPRTPSGKIQRFRCRNLLLRDELPLAAAVDL